MNKYLFCIERICPYDNTSFLSEIKHTKKDIIKSIEYIENAYKNNNVCCIIVFEYDNSIKEYSRKIKYELNNGKWIIPGFICDIKVESLIDTIKELLNE